MTSTLTDLVGALAEQGIGATIEPVRAGLRVSDVHHDSRTVQPGSLFACVPGATTDGHDHAPQAVESGATALLVERPLGLGVPEIVVGDARAALGPIAAAVHGHPSRALDVVGVTGTNGKTTTVRIVASILETLGVDTVEIGTLTGARTTPEAPELQRQLVEARGRGIRVVAMEVSSHALDLRRVDGTHFRVAAFTNLGVDHLDHHGDVESYFDAKARLFEPAFSDQAIIDVTTPAGRRLADRVTIPTVEIDHDAIEVQELGPTGSRFSLRGVEIDVPLGGAFNVANAAIAAEIVVALGHPLGDVAAALSHVSPVPGRFEAVEEGQAFSVLVDYAHTPDGLDAVLTAARRVTERDLVVVFGAGGDRDAGKRPQMGAVARRKADRVVVTNDNPRNEHPDAIISAIVSGMDRPPELIEPDRRLAIRHAFAGLRRGDVVVIAGKGHEATQTIGDEVLDFDDRSVAREEIRRLLGAAS